jgi:cell division cycle 2-like
MASKGSRWAMTEADAALAERRKQEKQEKKRLKEEKAQQAAEEAAAAAAATAHENYHQTQNGEPPAKRRRKSPTPVAELEAHVLSFPSTGFGPSASVEEYELLNAIEEGSYGKVSRARTKSSGTIVALKKLKIENNSQEGFPITGLREIQTLRACSHPHIIPLHEVVVGSSLSE